MTSEETQGARLHGLSPVFQIGSYFLTLVLPGLFFLVFAAGDSYTAWYMVAFLPAVSISLIRYFTLRYDLTSDHIVVREGLIFRSVRHIPYSRIQNVDTKQNPLHRLFGVAEVRLETAGGSEPEATFRVLSTQALERIRSGVFAWRNEALPDAPAEPEEREQQQPAFFRMGNRDIVIFGLLSQKGLALLAGLMFLMWEFELWNRIERALPFDPEEASKSVSFLGWVIAVLGLIALLQLLTIAWSYLTLYGFRIVRKQDGLATYCGIWIKQSATLPRHRIHFLSVREGLFSRWLGQVSVRVMTAGGDQMQEGQISRKWLIPSTRRERLHDILQEVQPELDLREVRWTRVHPKAYRRMLKRSLVLSLLPSAIVAIQMPLVGLGIFAALALFSAWGMSIRARRLGYALGPNTIMVRDGILTRERNVVRFSKIQSVSVKQSPLDRRHRMASLEVDTAGQNDLGLRLRIPYLALETAEELKQQLSSRAAQASFRW